MSCYYLDNRLERLINATDSSAEVKRKSYARYAREKIMKKHFAILLAAMTMTGFASMAVAADSPILTSLKGQGVAVQKLNADTLDKVRGTGKGPGVGIGTGIGNGGTPLGLGTGKGLGLGLNPNCPYR